MKSKLFKTVFIPAAAAVIVAVGLIVLRGGDSGRSPEIRNVLLVSIDTCRADFLSSYGYPLETTPNIDAISQEGLLFENAYTPVPFTLPAHSSMLTGAIPPQHGVLDNSDYILGRENLTLAEILKQEGFSTGAFVSCFIIDSIFGLAQGFDTYDDDFGDEFNTMGINERRGGETTSLAVKWLQEHKDERNFLFLHLFDPHFAYEPPEPFASRFEPVWPAGNRASTIPGSLLAAYAGEIAYADHCIGQVVDTLKKLGVYDSTLIVITADHGEMLGQHGESNHGYFIYQPAVHVPLIIRLPGRSEAVRIKTPAGLVDIVPTVCSALGIEPPAGIRGKDLTRYCADGSEPYPQRHVYCQSLEATKYDGNPLLGVIDEQYKYIRTTRPELYDLATDPEESENLFAQQRDRARAMQRELESILRQSSGGPGGRVALDAQTRQRLESLGYVGSRVEDSFAVNPEKADPKDLIEYHARAMGIGFLIHDEQFDLAKKQCIALIEDRPSFYKAYFQLAKMYVMQENFTEAIPYLHKVIELKPDDANAYEALGDIARQQDRLGEAVEYYAKVLELKPDYVRAYHQLAICLIEQGKYEAVQEYRSEALLEAPAYPEAAGGVAQKLLEKGQIKPAWEQYGQVLELAPDSVDALNTLAWLQATSDIEGVRNPEQAVQYARRACELTEFEKPEVLDTLAAAYAASGNFDRATETAARAIELADSGDRDDLAGRIRNRLRLYRNGRPYLDPALRSTAGAAAK